MIFLFGACDYIKKNNNNNFTLKYPMKGLILVSNSGVKTTCQIIYLNDHLAIIGVAFDKRNSQGVTSFPNHSFQYKLCS